MQAATLTLPLSERITALRDRAHQARNWSQQCLNLGERGLSDLWLEEAKEAERECAYLERDAQTLTHGAAA